MQCSLVIVHHEVRSMHSIERSSHNCSAIQWQASQVAARQAQSQSFISWAVLKQPHVSSTLNQEPQPSSQHHSHFHLNKTHAAHHIGMCQKQATCAGATACGASPRLWATGTWRKACPSQRLPPPPAASFPADSLHQAARHVLEQRGRCPLLHDRAPSPICSLCKFVAVAWLTACHACVASSCLHAGTRP